MASTNSWPSTSLDLNINAFNSIDSTTPIKAPIKEDKPVDGSQTRVLVEELTRITSENKILTHKLSVLSESYSVLRNQLADLISNSSDKQLNLSTLSSNKRKAESEDCSNNYYILNSRPTESSSSDELDSANKMANRSIGTCISRVYFRTNPLDACLGVKDGYCWKKYGQKVTKDNPSPRAYFKCSFAPSCPVKKKVQRSEEDPSVLVAIYEGEHNHKQQELCSDRRQVIISPIARRSSPTSGPSTATLDLTQNGSTIQPNNSKKGSEETDEASATQQNLVQKMASSLTRDPNFTAALAAAISGRFNCTRT